MGRLKWFFVMLLIIMVSACADSRQGQSGKSLPDTPENRQAEAKRFMEIMPPKELLQGLAQRVAKTVPEKDREMFVKVMNSKDTEQSVHKIILDALVKHYTVGELHAMVAFYGSPEGHSAYTKFPAYMAVIMPQIQQEVKKSMAEAQKQQPPQEQPKPQDQPSGKKEPTPQKSKK